MQAIAGVLVVAAAATAGDFIWYAYGVQHTMAAGLVHGALLLAAVGAVLGAARGRVLKGLPVGAIAGTSGAAAYFALVAAVDRRTYGTAIPAAWLITWLVLAMFEGRWLVAPAPRSWRAIARRGLIAAALSGATFYLVMNTLWGPPPDAGRSYIVQYCAWVFAWGPGLLTLANGSASTGARDGLIAPADLFARLVRRERPHILDVRSEGEFAAGHVPGAVNIPITALPFRMADVPGDAGDELIVYCGHGPRAHIAAAALRLAGRTRIVYLSGHWTAWRRAALTSGSPKSTWRN
jgi:rhodanese-related sulfurtransferase